MFDKQMSFSLTSLDFEPLLYFKVPWGSEHRINAKPVPILDDIENMDYKS